MKKAALPLLPVLALILPGCQPGQMPKIATAPTEPLVCSQWLPISYASRHDTALTISQVRRSNAARRAYCSSELNGAVHPAFSLARL
jgi:hypothetical protein